MGVKRSAMGMKVSGAVWLPISRRHVVRQRLKSRSKANISRNVHVNPVNALGAVCARVGGLVGVEPEDSRLVAIAVPVAIAVATLFGTIGVVVVVAVMVLAVRSRRCERERVFRQRVERSLPEVVDLLGLVVAAGCTTSSALREVAPRSPEPFRSELAALVRRAEAGEPVVESVRRLRSVLGNSVDSLAYSLIAAEVDGVPLRPALERVSDEAYRRRRVRAEEAARRVPVLMLFPLVFCVLPAFCLLTVVPLLAASIRDLQLGDTTEIIAGL